MLDVPGHPVLDKTTLVGGCVRLRMRVDAGRLKAEVRALPEAVWGTTGGRVGVHRAAEAVFLRGFAPAEGERPVEDRPALDTLAYARSLIEERIPAPALRCLLARLPAGGVVAAHVDRAPYFGKTLRVHIPVESNDSAFMQSAGLIYRMAPGEVWMLNNSTLHGVWNAHPSLARTHLICDFLPSPQLLELLRDGERDLGMAMPEVARMTAAPASTGAVPGA